MTLQRAIEVADLLVENEDTIRKKALRCYRATKCVNSICLAANTAKLAQLLGISEGEINYFFVNYAPSFFG